MLRVWVLLFAISCSETSFKNSGKGQAASPNNQNSQNNQGTSGSPESQNGVPNDGANGSPQNPSDPTTGNNSSDPANAPVPETDYKLCSASPEAGKRGYGRCHADEALVIVNDGTAQEITCCPFKSKGILSPNPAELNIARQGSCQQGEVATGLTASNGAYLCSKVNPTLYDTGTPVKATYANDDDDLSETLRKIAAAYNVNDTCVCPENTFMFGGKVSRDNVCEDMCVPIKRKGAL